MWIPWGQAGRAAAHGLVWLLENPLLYIGLGLMVWELSRNVRHERKLFGVRVTRPWRTTFRRLGQGVVAGLAASILCTLLGVAIHPHEIFGVTACSVLLGVLRLRWAGTLYAASVMAGLAAVARMMHLAQVPASVAAVLRWLADCDSAACLALAAVACFAEACLFWWNRRRPAAPAMVLSRRGKGMGGLLLQLCFMVPVLTVAPGGVPLPAWVPASWPWAGHLDAGRGVSWTGIPLLAGHADLWTTRMPWEGLRPLFFYDVLAVCAYGAGAWAVHTGWTVYAWLLPLAGVLCREGLVWWLRAAETVRDPVFVPSSVGVRILAVLEGSLAETMGLKPGEIITHVNQVPVHSAYDLHFAISQNPAYARLQVIDERGEPRLVGKPVYAGERHRLGLVLPPEDEDTAVFLRFGSGGLFHSLYMTQQVGRAGRRRLQEEPPGLPKRMNEEPEEPTGQPTRVPVEGQEAGV